MALFGVGPLGGWAQLSILSERKWDFGWAAVSWVPGNILLVWVLFFLVNSFQSCSLLRAVTCGAQAPTVCVVDGSVMILLQWWQFIEMVSNLLLQIDIDEFPHRVMDHQENHTVPMAHSQGVTGGFPGRGYMGQSSWRPGFWGVLHCFFVFTG